MNDESQLREKLAEFLDSRSAHISFDDAVRDFPLDKINDRPAGSPHSAWELLEHIRIAQWDILEFSRNSSHVSPDWPAGYWPEEAGTAESWEGSVQQVRSDREEMQKLTTDASVNLFDRLPHGDGQTILREALLIIDHNAYHLGQLMLLRRMLESS